MLRKLAKLALVLDRNKQYSYADSVTHVMRRLSMDRIAASTSLYGADATPDEEGRIPLLDETHISWLQQNHPEAMEELRGHFKLGEGEQVTPFNDFPNTIDYGGKWRGPKNLPQKRTPRGLLNRILQTGPDYQRNMERAREVRETPGDYEIDYLGSEGPSAYTNDPNHPPTEQREGQTPLLKAELFREIKQAISNAESGMPPEDAYSSISDPDIRRRVQNNHGDPQKQIELARRWLVDGGIRSTRSL